MTTYDDRLAALERKVASMEIERLYEKRQRRETTPSEEAFQDVNHNLTMLLGIASGQENDLKSVKDELMALRGDIEQRFVSVDNKLEQILLQLTKLIPQSE